MQHLSARGQLLFYSTLVGIDAMNAVDSTTFEMDQKTRHQIS